MVRPIHVVLAGDSIFDNDAYVGGGRGVLEQMRRSMPEGWTASRIAVDGARIDDVARQLAGLPHDATDLVLSVGGNDMVGYSHLLATLSSAEDMPQLVAAPIVNFERKYARLLDRLAALPVRLAVSTVYTIPFQEPVLRQFAPAAIAAFNQVIARKARRHGASVLRLEVICTDAKDFSSLSPIEPSEQGGQKIVEAIIEVVQTRPLN